MKNLKLKKGFTLTELIIVIVIIGILAAVLIPSLSSYIKKAKKSAAEQDAMTIHSQFISTVDNDVYDEISQLNFVVKLDKYTVIIEKGALKASYENTEVSEKFDVSNAITEANDIESLCKALTNATKTKKSYVLITDGQEYSNLFVAANSKVSLAAGSVYTEK